jgi:NADP-dependent 3-hydroxy acid dehydrogenase YdfG
VKPAILITGASRGLGNSLAKALCKDHKLILVDKYPILEPKSRNICKIQCDISVNYRVIQMVNRAISRFDRIDVLINNAGLMFFNKFEDIGEEIDSMYNTNIKGTLFTSQAVLPIMRKQKAGYIINISSTRGITGAPNKGAYAVTKFGVRALAETLFQENEKYGIKTTSICPGKLDKKLVTHEDIINTIKYLLKLGPKAYVKEIIIGGQL